MRKELILLAAISFMPLASTTSWAESVAIARADTAADEQAIHAVHDHWAELILGKDAPGIERLYANDAVLMAPGEAAVVGAAAIGARWGRLLGLDDFAFGLNLQQLVVSSSGDLAHERGTYDFAATFPLGAVTDTGKYVLVWQKTGGEWKVIADIFNSDPTPAAN